jgi:hypothetical protein
MAFGDYSLDLANEQLLCSDEVVALTPKAFAVLRRLVEEGRQLVSKRGATGSSSSARRISRMMTLSTPSPTWVLAHPACSSSSFVRVLKTHAPSWLA